MGTLLFLSSSKGSPQEQQDGSPPSQFRTGIFSLKKPNLECSIEPLYIEYVTLTPTLGGWPYG